VAQVEAAIARVKGLEIGENLRNLALRPPRPLEDVARRPPSFHSGPSLRQVAERRHSAEQAGEARLRRSVSNGWFGVIFHSKAWTATAAGMPESDDDDLSGMHVVVDVVPDPR
jgi:hypothetical protein